MSKVHQIELWLPYCVGAPRHNLLGILMQKLLQILYGRCYLTTKQDSLSWST
jgi:hypothetical protein